MLTQEILSLFIPYLLNNFYDETYKFNFLCVQLSLLKHLQSCSGNSYKTKSSQAHPSITVPLVETLHVAVDGKYLRIVSFAFSVGQILKAFTTLVSSIFFLNLLSPQIQIP